MTDTSSLLNNNVALTSDVLYNLKPSVARCRSYRCSIPSSNKSTFLPSDLIQCYIPARRNCFLDQSTSYMRFTVKNLDISYNLFVDGTAGSFINRLDVYHGSNMLETIQNYDVLMSYLVDTQTDYAQRYGLEGTYGCTANRQGVDVSGGLSQTFTLPIISGTVGCLADKLLPLSLADDIRLDFNLNTNQLGGCWNNLSTLPTFLNSTWQITSFELELNILELSDDAMRMVSSVTPFTEPIYLHGTSYRHYSNNIAASSVGNQSFLIPSRFASLKQLIVLPRRSTELVANNAYSISSRINPNIEQYWFRIGSLLCPQRPVVLKNANTTGGYAEGLMEIYRANHSVSSPALAGSLPLKYFNVCESGDATSYKIQNVSTTLTSNLTTGSYLNGFAIALELESIVNRNDVILSGMNTLSQQCFFEYVSNTAIGTAPYTIDTFANFDMITVLSPDGLLSTRF